MLSAQILNSQATLNNYIVLDSIEFIPGEQLVLVVKLINKQLGIRYVVDNLAATAKFIFNKSNGETEEVSATFMANDRSILSSTITENVSSEILGGSFTVEIDVAGDQSDIKKAVASNALSRIILGEC